MADIYRYGRFDLAIARIGAALSVIGAALRERFGEIDLDLRMRVRTVLDDLDRLFFIAIAAVSRPPTDFGRFWRVDRSDLTAQNAANASYIKRHRRLEPRLGTMMNRDPIVLV